MKDERRLALKAIAKLQTDPLYKKLTIEAVAWDKPDDHLPLLAGIDPQSAIEQGLPRPSECDIVVALFWSRMGTPLDASRYPKPGGGQYLSGTEWELDETLQAFRERGRPKVVVYRRMEDVTLNPRASDFKERLHQWELVEQFFAGFNNPDDSIRLAYNPYATPIEFGKNADGSIRLAYNPYATPTEFGDIFEHHLHKIIAQLLEEKPARDRPQPVLMADNTVPAISWPAGKSPFPGLRAFGPDDAPVFFGRGAETDQLLKRLADPACRFLVVVGASGSGKSSLVGAGLVPRLREGALSGSETWPVITFSPDAWGTGDPFDALTAALVADALRLPPRDLGRRLRADPAGLRAALEEHLASSPDWRQAVLVIDQFEEAFRRVPDEAKCQAFLAALDEAARSPRLRIVVTMRDDFYRYFVQSPVLSRLVNASHGAFNLSAPAPLEMHEMMTGPAQVAGLEFEAGLARQLLTDTGTDAGALALLAYALDQLYAARDGQNRLTWTAYNTFGRVQGAIGARAQSVFESLPEAAQAALPRVFRELVEVDESGAATRKRAPLKRVEADEACAQLTRALVDARLMVTARSAQDEALVEVAHEALFRSWPRLTAWIEEAQDDLILLRQVRAAAAWWDRRGRGAAYLWPDERLQPVYQMQERLRPELTAVEREFIRLEFDRLIEEIDKPATSHRRRSFIGERLDTLRDRRPGVGPVRALGIGRPFAAAELRPGEVRLWGDRPEHESLPDIVWLKADGARQYRLNTDGGDEGAYDIAPFYISKYLITYNQFQAFIDAPDGFTDPRRWQGLAADDDDKKKPGEQNFKFGNHPRENVSWYDAIAFCRWLNVRLGWPDIPADMSLETLDTYAGLRLPTEWEWQWAATGGRPGYEYPWGPEWNGAKANTRESGLGRTTAVGMYLDGAAPCGALDMSGNVWEWCLNEYDQPHKIGLKGSNPRVVRGGSWLNYLVFARPTDRFGVHPVYRINSFGFRVGCGRPPSL